MKTHKDLTVWKKSLDFVTSVYSVTNNFPKNELYGLTNQIRRASVSISSNIAEGAARNHTKEFIQFLYYSLSSAAEVDTQLRISENLKYLEKEKSKELISDLESISKMLQGLIRSIKQ